MKPATILVRYGLLALDLTVFFPGVVAAASLSLAGLSLGIVRKR